MTFETMSPQQIGIYLTEVYTKEISLYRTARKEALNFFPTPLDGQEDTTLTLARNRLTTVLCREVLNGSMRIVEDIYKQKEIVDNVT